MGGNERLGDAVLSSYLSDPALTPARVGRFFAATRALAEAQPWALIDDDALVQVAIPSQELDNGCLSVVGAIGAERGLNFFPDFADYEELMDGAERDATGEAHDPSPHHSALSLRLVESARLPGALRDELAQHGWPLADAGAYPLLSRLRDGEPMAIRAGDVQLATALMNALVDCLNRHPHAFEAYGEVTVHEASTDDGLALSLGVPHPMAVLDDADRSPRAPTGSSANPYGLPLSTEELGALTRVLGGPALHRALGVLCAAASVPGASAADAWLAEATSEGGFASTDERAATEALLRRVQAHVQSVLGEADTDSLVPEADDVDACRAWARGYASVLGKLDPDAVDAELLDSAFAIQALAEVPEMLALLDKFRGARSREAMLRLYRESLADDADFLYEGWAEARTAPRVATGTVRREAPKVGRNDPCSCGSGKKYKKCCGAD
jgi:uncharacterized protein